MPDPATRTGALIRVVSPVAMRAPQQYAALLTVTPQVLDHPALIDTKVMPPLTGVGVRLGAVVPVPSSPLSFAPQQ